MPRITVGIPSRISSHRQPFQPSQSRCIKGAEIAAPTMFDVGMAIMNKAIVLARSSYRNQCVRYMMTPGKKPACATPRKNLTQ